MHDHHTTFPPFPPLPDTALKAFVGIACKAGGDWEAHSPRGTGGWPAYVTVPDRTFWRATAELEARGLVSRETVWLGLGRRTKFFVETGGEFGRINGERQVRINGAWMVFQPHVLRVAIAAAGVADFDNGESHASVATIARCAGRSKRNSQKALARLRSDAWLKRNDADQRRWMLGVHGGNHNSGPGRAGQFCWLPTAVLDAHFGFCFRSRQLPPMTPTCHRRHPLMPPMTPPSCQRRHPIRTAYQNR